MTESTNPFEDAQAVADHERELADLRRANLELQRRLAKAKAKIDDLVDATFAGARDAMLTMGPVPPVPPPPSDKRHKRPMVALWDMGDWQASKVTPSYNFGVMRKRVATYCERAIDITELERSAHPVRRCHIIFGGDMVEGLFNFPTQVFEIDATLHEQWEQVSYTLIDVVRRALANYDAVDVTAEPGNHGRIGSKRDHVPRSDNIDRMCYTFARAVLSAEKRLTWHDCPEDIQRLEIGNYRALVVHGDEVGRNGYVSPETFRNHVMKWKSGGYDWSFRDCYVHHYHEHLELPLPDGAGAVFWTGSTESDNRYARVGMATTAIPSQRLHFIDPDKGRVSSQYKIWLSDEQR